MERMLVISLICLAMLFSSIHADAKEALQPPKELHSLVNKWVTFQDDRLATFICRIVGVSDYPYAMGRTLTLSVTDLDYRGDDGIRKISYEENPDRAMGEWRLEKQGKVIKIDLISFNE